MHKLFPDIIGVACKFTCHHVFSNDDDDDDDDDLENFYSNARELDFDKIVMIHDNSLKAFKHATDKLIEDSF